MDLIVNTNRIIAALIKDGISRKIITHSPHKLLTIKFSEKEIEKHKSEIKEKAKISEKEYEFIVTKIKDQLIIIDDTIINTKMEEAKQIMDHIDRNDTPFIAAALAINADIWSDNKHFQQQKRIKTWTTENLKSHFF